MIDHDKTNWETLGRELNPYPTFQQRRLSAPVRYDQRTGLWEVFGYTDVQRILLDHTNFSSAQLAPTQERQNLLTSDNPYHDQLRSLVNIAFTPRIVGQLTLHIKDIVSSLFDQLPDSFDLIHDIAEPLPAMVMAKLLGVPESDHRQLKSWADQLAQNLLKLPNERSLQVYKEIRSYFLDMLAQRRREPGEDLISALLAAQIDDRDLSEYELINFGELLLGAGSETTTNSIGNLFYLLFYVAPEMLEELRGHPAALIPGAVEETLRYLSPLQWVARVARQDLLIAGEHIKGGQIVLNCVASANRDESQFPQAETFNIRRTPNRHLAFGRGIHFCLGAPLARLETHILLEVFLERLEQGISWSPGEEVLRRADGPLFYGLRRLPFVIQR